ncbi:MAG: excinuclease ABC subunit UvrA [Anaerolineae bacterium]|nr:excinuclease ABC subunit UvrA [Candidatus Roseilinea sp.]MDW8448503.1 excinuclease ABC subunit UvrA [Anaerolineae bacterium]
MAQDKIVVRGARVHNLKNINVEIPRDKLVVITGLSGSGKSSLAFDTIFAEGQRRYVESLSAYARQFLGQMEKPDVDQIEGLSPAVSIDQKGSSHNPRSTVGTVTEIYDYLRLMFARIGVQYSPVTGLPLVSQTPQQIVDQIAALPPGTRVQILAPLIKDKKGHHQQVFEDVRKQGFARVRVDGEIRSVDEDIELDRYKLHNIEAVVDRLVVPVVWGLVSGVWGLGSGSGGQGSEVGSRESKVWSEALDDEERRQFLTRLNDSVETALKLGDGFMIAMVSDGGQGPGVRDQALTSDPRSPAPAWRDILFSEKKVDPATGKSYPDLEPKLFSFNAPQGACPECQGLGSKREIDPALIVPNPDLSLEEGAINANGWNSDDEESWGRQMLRAVCKAYDIPMHKPWRQLSPAQRDLILYGAGGERVRVNYVNRLGERRQYDVSFEGVIPNLMRRYRESTSDYIKQSIEEVMTFRTCEACGGKRLKEDVLCVKVAGKNIAEVTDMSISEALAWIDSLGIDETEVGSRQSDAQKNGKALLPTPDFPVLSDRDKQIARQIVKEIRARLQFLVDVGLDYLTLSRSANTLSGGEAQRIRLATQVGSQLMGVLYVLDEPSIGLHQRDQQRLINTLTRMRDLGNTVLVVEHDDDTMRAADWIIDMGPGAGEHGGQIVATGAPEQIMKHKASLTGAYLSGRKRIAVPKQRRAGNGKTLIIKGARENNLKNIDVEIPLGKFVVVTGVSGSGKSSLIVECLYKALANRLNGALEHPGELDDIIGLEHLDKVINIDQQPIGRTPRSNPATYTGLWTPLRELFAELPESKIRGYKSGRFSFNVKGGRCEACEGQGVLQIQMQFMPDIYVTCDVCHGTRFNRETLQVRYKGKNIAEVLDMTVTEAMAFFKDIPPIARKLQTLEEVGLGYIRLGQPATTLSGGEAQRVKLSRELSKRATGRTIYVLDEPSVGLHHADVHKLIHVLNKLVDDGNTVVVIEHHLDIIKVADWVIDLGPEGGEGGGRIVAQGTPEEVAQVAESYTGRFLKRVLDQAADWEAKEQAVARAAKRGKQK